MDQSGGLTKTSKELVRIALDANITLQTALTAKAQKLEADLKEIDRLLVRTFLSGYAKCWLYPGFRKRKKLKTNLSPR